MLGLDPELGRGPLFGELLPSIVRDREVDAHYVPSSPTGGALPFRPDTGVAHYFGVGAYRRPLEDARRAEVRFASECLAFANVPADDVLDAPGGPGRLVHTPAWKAGVPRDTGTGWDFDDVRDHYLRTVFGLDPVDLRWSDPERYLTLSRLVTGEVMAATLGEWRRRRSTCRGALLWTLNDVLPGAGWGVLDSRGEPKAAYWLVRRVLRPVAVWLTDEGTNGIAVHLANDGPGPVRGSLEVTLHRSDGVAVETAERELELAPHTVTELSAEDVLGRFVDIGHVFAFGPPGHDTVAATLRSADGGVSAQAFRFPNGYPLGREPVASLGLDGAATATPDGVRLTLSSARLAYGVSLRAEGFAPDDDWLTLAPGCPRVVLLRALEPGREWDGAVLDAVNGSGTVRVGRGAGA
jgi:beta-mannosidase